MKYFLTVIILLIVCAAFIKNNGRQNNDPFQKLYLLEGNWVMKTKKGAIGEEWIKINKDYLQSRGYMIRDGDTTVNERVALKNTTEGIFYTSTVENQNDRQAIPFRLTSANNNIFVFENAQHDYPKRIAYQFITKDSINAWIDDGTENPAKRSAFHYTRQQ